MTTLADAGRQVTVDLCQNELFPAGVMVLALALGDAMVDRVASSGE